MRHFLACASVLLFCAFPKVNFAYPPNLGAAANFIFFTPAGAIGNTGTSTITGDIGNNVGAVTGLAAPTIFNGNIHNADVTSWQVVYDISTALGQLLTQTPLQQLSGSIGNGQVIAPGTYNTVGAVAVAGNLVLDGGGDTNAVFIFQVNGAFNTVAASTITLTNGASASNIFWAANGAASLGANSVVAGTIIAKGAIAFGAGVNFLGRALSTTGAITINTFTGSVPNGPSITTVQPNCSGGAGSITINAPVGNNYTYSIGGAYQSSTSFSSLAFGSYPITIKNGSGAIISSGVSSIVNTQYQPTNPYNLGAAGGFVLFSSDGAISNTSTSNVAIGDIGTNSGAISGMASPTTVAGGTHDADATTAQAKSDLSKAYDNLKSQTATGSFPSAPTDGQVFTPGIYSIAAASAINGNIVLDAGSNANALFVFEIGGAFTTGAGASILLKNGTDPSRVFWVVNGAAAFAASTTIIGNVINNAAISFGDGSVLVGRALSTVGAVSIYGTLVSAPFQCYMSTPILLPVTFGQFSAIAKNCEIDLSFQVLSQQNNKQFEVEHATTLNGNWETLAVIAGDAQNAAAKTYQFVHPDPPFGNNYYRIKQADLDGKATYSALASAVNNCANIAVSSYPNPVKNQLTVLLPTGMGQATIRIGNSLGQIIYSQMGRAYENTITTAGLVPGIYILQVIVDNKVVFKSTIVRN